MFTVYASNMFTVYAPDFVTVAAPEYIHEEESQQLTPEGHDVVDNYTYSEPQQQVVVSDNWGEDPLPEEPPSFSNEMAVAPEEPVPAPPVPPHVEEPVGEPVKKTYASIVCPFLLTLSFNLFDVLLDAALKL